MEQQPIDGYAPLDPPDAALAQSYLAEADAVHARREERIDRRAMARLHFINAAVFFVYLTVYALSSRTEGGAGVVLLLVPLLAWAQLHGELRESYGYQARMRGARLGWHLGGFVVIIALFLLLTGWGLFAGPVPTPLLFVPGVLAAVVFVVLGIRERRAARRTASVSSGAILFTRGGRIMTVGVGLGAGLVLAAQGVADSLAVVASSAQLVGLVALVVWMLAAQSGAAVPALGWMWHAPQWTIFALSGAALAVLALLPSFSVVVPPLVGVAVGTAVLIAFAVVAFAGARRAG